MNKKTLLTVCILLVAVLVGAGVLYNQLQDQVQVGGLATQPPQETAPTENTAEEAADYAAPDFTVQDWEGNPVKLSEFIGKPVILNFWASWCGPCKMEMPDFEAAYQRYGEEIHFVMVNCTAGDAMEDAKALIQDAGYTFPVYFDTTSEAASIYGASSIPLTYFIDAQGNLVTYGRGALSAELLETGIGYIYTPAE